MKRFLSILLITALLQGGIYLYLDRVVLVPQASFTQQAVSESRKTNPPGIYSYDHSYYAQLSATGLKIFAMPNSNLCREISLNPNQVITYFTWLADKNLALAGISTDSSRGTSVTLQPINLETGSKPVIPEIAGLYRGAKIVDVALSPETNVINILVKNNRFSAVYRTDANNYLRKLYLNTSDIGRIATLSNTVDLFYDSPATGNVYLLDANGRIKHISPKGNNYSLIGVDRLNRIYIGRLDSSQKVEMVMVGDKRGNFRNFKQLSYPCPPGSVRIGYDGKLSVGTQPNGQIAAGALSPTEN